MLMPKSRLNPVKLIFRVIYSILEFNHSDRLIQVTIFNYQIVQILALRDLG